MMQKIIKILSASAICFFIFQSAHFLLEQIANPWPHDLLIIDGLSYLRGASYFSTHKNFFHLADNYHSPGYQIFLGLLLSDDAVSKLVTLSKLLSFSFYIASIFLLYKIGKILFTDITALLAATLFSASVSWMYYINMIQYELIIGFLLLLILFLALRASKKKSYTILQTIFSGLLLTVVSIFHLKFSPLLFLPMLSSSKKPFIKITGLLCALVPFLLWLVIRASTIKNSQGISGTFLHQFHFSNHIGATGEFDIFHQKIMEPSGLEFILSYPGTFLWLIWQRFLFFWGIKQDIWSVPPSITYESGALSFFAIAGCVVFFIGFITSCVQDIKTRNTSKIALYFIVGVLIFPIVGFVSSQRYLVPLVPFIALFQAYAIELYFLSILNKKKPRSYPGHFC